MCDICGCPVSNEYKCIKNHVFCDECVNENDIFDFPCICCEIKGENDRDKIMSCIHRLENDENKHIIKKLRRYIMKIF